MSNNIINRAYYVIGGQYESHYYGASATLRGAKQIAARNREYWDNWQGWHTPRIYKAEDCRDVESRGRITTPDGATIRVHDMYADPVA